MHSLRGKSVVISFALAVAIQPITSGSLFENRTEFSIGGIFAEQLTQENQDVVWVLSNAFEIAISGISSDSKISLDLHIPFGPYAKPTEVMVDNGKSRQNMLIKSVQHFDFTVTKGSQIRLETEDFIIPSSVDSASTDNRQLYLGISNLKIVGAGWKARMKSVLGL
jgi:hypothetical protein